MCCGSAPAASLQAVFLSAVWHHMHNTARCSSAGRVAVTISALQGRCRATLSSLVDCNSRPLQRPGNSHVTDKDHRTLNQPAPAQTSPTKPAAASEPHPVALAGGFVHPVPIAAAAAAPLGAAGASLGAGGAGVVGFVVKVASAAAQLTVAAVWIVIAHQAAVHLAGHQLAQLCRFVQLVAYQTGLHRGMRRQGGLGRWVE